MPHEIEKVSGKFRLKTNEQIIQALEDLHEHPIKYGYAPNVERVEFMSLIRHNGQILVLWDEDRKCERLLHINNIIDVGGRAS